MLSMPTVPESDRLLPKLTTLINPLHFRSNRLRLYINRCSAWKHHGFSVCHLL